MQLEPALNAAKYLVVEGIGLTSLVLAGVALTLIEIWGIKKIWKLMNSDDSDKAKAL